MNEQNIIDELENLNVEVFKVQNSSILIKKRIGTFTDLLDNLQELKIVVNRKGRVFNFEEPIYISKIVFISNGEKPPNLNIELNDLRKKRKIISGTFSRDNVLYADIFNACNSITISPNGSLNFKEKLQTIRIYGCKLSDLCDLFEDMNSKYEKLKECKNDTLKLLDESKKIRDEYTQKNEEYVNKVANQEDEVEEKAQRIVVLSTEVQGLELTIKNNKSELEKHEDTIRKSKEKTQELDDKKENLADSISQLDNQRSTLNTNIANADAKLKKLSNDINMYSENISDYNKEIRRQALIYSVFVMISLVALGMIAYELVLKINDLIEYYVGMNTITQGKTPALEFLYLRAPMAVVVSCFIYLFSNIITKLVQKIINMNDTKRELIAASIIAREASESSSEGLELTQREIYDLKESLKLEFLIHTIFSGHIEAIKKTRERKRACNGDKLQLPNPP